jgi:hypothetical protein
MQAVFTLGTTRDGYECPFCSAANWCEWGIEHAPVIDCTNCSGVGVLVEEPVQTAPRTVQKIPVALRAVKRVRVHATGEEANLDPPTFNAFDGAKGKGIDIRSGFAMWLTTTDGVTHGYHKSS